MTRRTDAAFSALAGLDPVLRLPADHGAAHQAAAVHETDLRIARITAVPRAGQIYDPPVARVQPRKASQHRQRFRYGALGLAASAGLAVLATLLWVSPSAGSPSNGMNGTLSAVGAGQGAGQTLASAATLHVGHNLAGRDSGAASATTGSGR